MCISSLKRHFRGLLPLWGAAHACPKVCLSASWQRGSPWPFAISAFSPLAALFSPVPACRDSGGPATRSHWLLAPGGGVDERGGPLAPGAGTLAWPPLSVLGGSARGCLDAQRDARAGAESPMAQKQGASRSRSRPSGLLSLGWETGSTLLWPRVGLRGHLGLIQLAGSHLPVGSPAWRGPEDPLEPAVEELAHMAQEARVALRSSCQALKFPSDHTSN